MCTIPTAINNEEININDTIIEKETTTVIQGVSERIVNVLGGDSMEYSE